MKPISFKLVLAGIGMLTFFGNLTPALALTACGPSSCTPAPGCGNTCTYYTCDVPHTGAVTVNHLPFNSYTAVPGACGDSLEGNTLAALPFTVPGDGTYHDLPVTVNHTYYTCQARTNSNPPCP